MTAATITWKEMESLDTEEIFHRMVDVLSDEQLESLEGELQGLRIEDDEYDEARGIILNFAQVNNITF